MENQSSLRQKRLVKGFTLIELLVVISIIALLLSILMPSLNKVRSRARSVICLTNCKQLGMALSTYAANNKDAIPTEVWRDKQTKLAKVWADLMIQQNRELSGLVCPTFPWQERGFGNPDFWGATGGYGLNNELDGVNQWDPDAVRTPVRISSFKRSYEIMFVLESAAYVAPGQTTPQWDYPFVDFMAVVPGNQYRKSGEKWAYIGGQARADHGQKPLQNRAAQPNYVFSGSSYKVGENNIDEARMNVLFLDQHAEPVRFGDIRNGMKMWMNKR